MANEKRYTGLIALKINKAVAEELRTRARQEDRTLSSFVRRLLAAGLESERKHGRREEATTR